MIGLCFCKSTISGESHKGKSILPISCCAPWTKVHYRVQTEFYVIAGLMGTYAGCRSSIMRGTLCKKRPNSNSQVWFPLNMSLHHCKVENSWVEAVWVGPVSDDFQTSFWFLCSVNYMAPLLSCQLIVCFHNSAICSKARMKCPALGSQRVPLAGQFEDDRASHWSFAYGYSNLLPVAWWRTRD